MFKVSFMEIQEVLFFFLFIYLFIYFYYLFIQNKKKIQLFTLKKVFNKKIICIYIYITFFLNY